jgi:hypothetical protein
MNIFERLFLTVVELMKQVWVLPQAMGNALQRRRQQTLFNDTEAERLDRIRQPWKYQGK